jgi:hypothetical protein
MTTDLAKFISTINWISHKLESDLRYFNLNYEQRLIETQKELEKALNDFISKQ